MQSDREKFLEEEVRTLRLALRGAEDECEILQEIVLRRDEQLSALKPDWKQVIDKDRERQR